MCSENKQRYHGLWSKEGSDVSYDSSFPMEGEITEAIRVRLPPEPIFQYYVNFRFFLNVL